MSPLQSLEHRAKRGGKNGAYEMAIFPLFFEFSSDSSCAADLSLGTTWARLLLISLVLGPGGLLLGRFSSCLVYRGSLGLLGFGLLVDH
jgi:hypothetical protein